jgi:hypothetical protein
MKNSTTKVALNLSLFAVAAALMCIGNQWLFFFGLALMVISGFLSVRPRPRMSWPAHLACGLLGLAAVGVFLWLSSWGREPLPPAAACAAILGASISEFGYWRASRGATEDA